MHEYVDGAVLQHEDRLATEEPLEVRCGWAGTPPYRVAVTMRTPGHDFELAAGFLFAERTLGGHEALQSVAYCTDETLAPEQALNVVTVTLRSAPSRVPAARYDGVSAGSSACGVCGTQSIEDVLALTAMDVAVVEHPLVSPEVLRILPARLRSQQRTFDKTGGLHAAGLFDADGESLEVREDIGRHNAVDKVIGARILAGLETSAPVLAVSGRIGFEIVQKAVSAGVAVLAAVGAPSSLAVDLAARSGLCVVGFLRPHRFVTYTAPERLGV
ncbi:formate dehydrogenase accessory sulfurtransferase FdhD [soil metagenome]